MREQMSTMMSYLFKLESWKKILFSVALGVFFGLLLGKHALYLKPIGVLFLNAIKMIIAPVVFTAIVCAILSINDSKKIRRVSIKALMLYAISMSIAAIIGLTISTLIAPGYGLILPSAPEDFVIQKMPQFSELVVNMVPTNIITAFSSMNIIQILIFSIFIGISINMAGEDALPVKKLFHSFSAVVFKFSSIIMSFAPVGIFALMATIIGEYGLKALVPLFKLVLSGYLSCFVLVLIYFSFTLQFIARLNPLHFFRGITNALSLAFSSSSSMVALPASVRCAEESLGISRGVAGFLLPLGTTLNLNGLAIYLSIAAIFTANIYDVHLSLIQYVMLVISIVVTSMGAGGIPGSALIVMGAVLSSIGLPLGAIPFIAGVDRIIDMGMTTTNVAGDLFTTLLIAKNEQELNLHTYNASQQVQLDANTNLGQISNNSFN
jgi:Na+/H+-dicarboxylate symporter